MMENKTASEQSANQQNPEEQARQPLKHAAVSRRSFLTSLWYLLGGIAIVEFLWLIGSFFKSHPQQNSANGQQVIAVGAAQDFLPGSVTAVPQGKLYLARLPDGGFLALARECTHLGCTVMWKAQEGQFQCPCHGSSFDLNGAVKSAPAPRPLDLYRVFIENGQVKVDLSKRSRRNEFNDTQAVAL